MVVLLFLADYKAFQILIINILAVIIFTYISYVNPYQSLFMNRMEKFNELITVLCLDFLFAFTDFAQTASGRTNNGWIIIALFYLQALINLAFIFGGLARFIKYRICNRLCGNSRRSAKGVIKIMDTSQTLGNLLGDNSIFKDDKLFIRT